MASERPRYLMRNATLWVNRISQIGQASEIGFPSLKRKMEKVFNAGMETEIEVPMGYEAPELGFKMTSFDPAVLTLFGLAIGVETEYMATGALVDDDGTTHSAVAYFRGMLSELTPDAHKRGDVANVDYKMSFRYYKLEIDGQPIYEIDPFEIKIGG
ncbi:MAG TPA: phage major tail tube protein, partial [Hyphomicrobium sp.]|nr:phage major tail tube protein [Hyphomicrobium sp.]